MWVKVSIAYSLGFLFKAPMVRISDKLKREKPWALIGISRRKYEATRPWKSAGLSREAFEKIVRLIPPEGIEDLKLEADAEKMLKGLFGNLELEEAQSSAQPEEDHG